MDLQFDRALYYSSRTLALNDNEYEMAIKRLNPNDLWFIRCLRSYLRPDTDTELDEQLTELSKLVKQPYSPAEPEIEFFDLLNTSDTGEFSRKIQHVSELWAIRAELILQLKVEASSDLLKSKIRIAKQRIRVD